MIIFVILLILIKSVSNYLLGEENQTTKFFINDTLIIIVVNIVSAMTVLAIVQSIIYFYYNFMTGYYYSFIIVFLSLGCFELLTSYQLLKDVDFKFLKVVLFLYLPLYVYGLLYNPYLIQMNVLDPYNFAISIIIKLPLSFLDYFNFFMQTNPIDSFLITNVGPLVLFYLLTFASLMYVNRYFSDDSGTQSSIDELKSRNISFAPYFALLLMFVMLQSANGLQEFFTILTWISCFVLLYIQLVTFIKKGESYSRSVQLRIILWISLALFSKYILPLLVNTFVIQYLLDIFNPIGQLIDLIVFIVLNIFVLVTVYYLLRELIEIEDYKVSDYLFYSILLLLIGSVPFLLVKLIITSWLIFIFSSPIEPKIEFNSINLNLTNFSDNLSKIILKKSVILLELSEIAIFFLAILII